MYPKCNYQNGCSKSNSQKKQIILQSPSNDPWWQTAHPTFPTKPHPFWCFGPGKHVMKQNWRASHGCIFCTQSKASGNNPAQVGWYLVGHTLHYLASFIVRGCFSSYKSNFHLASPSTLSTCWVPPTLAPSGGWATALAPGRWGSGDHRWVGNPLSLELLKWEPKPRSSGSHLFIIAHTQCPSFSFVSHIFLPLFEQSVHTSNLQKVNQTQILKPLTCVTYACWYTCPT